MEKELHQGVQGTHLITKVEEHHLVEHVNNSSTDVGPTLLGSTTPRGEEHMAHHQRTDNALQTLQQGQARHDHMWKEQRQ
jgi:hypothetical protein